MDIFDAADLLAIEQDALSSSSDNPVHEDKDDPLSHPNESQLDDGHPLNSKQSSTQNLLGGNVEASGDDDDSSDDGFLESMLTLENESTLNNIQQTLDEKELRQEEPESDTKVRCHETINGRVEARNSLDENEKLDEAILFGDSIGRWMTIHQASKENPKTKQTRVKERPMCKHYDGVTSIQNIEDRLNDDKQSFPLRLSIGKKRKRQSVFGGEVAEATLEQFHVSSDDTQNNGNRQQICGIVAIAPDAERASIGTMVDCLARYDHEKGAYILEIVDLDVSGLGLTATTPEHGEDAENGEIAALTEKYKSAIADPRSRAKQAEKQVRKLKQGKRTRSERKNPDANA
uniref:Uncharacterized protein n=1 Tax=Skeletonema marinoi TaxID=267567 RepID=A0A7S2VGA1_9STRA|mmetsp:Transcript_8244/g.13915  ORF Transcript_8244/g.13915 Transcript_8244/m.13915 type:complete len:346 (+) Transcript_8244:78-1115(+)